MKFCVMCGENVDGKAWNTKYCSECRRKVKLESKRRSGRKCYIINRDEILKKKRLYEQKHKDQRIITYKKYRNTDRYREYSRNRYHAIPENIRKARYYIHNAVRDGLIKKPKICEKCGVKDWGVKRSMIEAHHYKGYEQQYWLIVQWFCVPCHKHAEEVLVG